MWDVLIITDRTIPVCVSDVALHDTEKVKTCLLIDIAIPDDLNLSKATKKLSRYKTWKSRSAGCEK